MSCDKSSKIFNWIETKELGEHPHHPILIEKILLVMTENFLN